MKLSKIEAKMLDEFLEHLIDMQGNAGCNDYTIKNTPENAVMVKEMNDFFRDEFDGIDAFSLMKDNKNFIGYDWAVVSFLRKKLI